jgi:hypothetical protein
MKRMITITLEQEYSFQDAVQAMLDGKCLGIRPGANMRYVEPFRPPWMKDKNDVMLQWEGGGGEIRATQFLGKWKLVVVDHRELHKQVENEGSEA